MITTRSLKHSATSDSTRPGIATSDNYNRNSGLMTPDATQDCAPRFHESNTKLNLLLQKVSATVLKIALSLRRNAFYTNSSEVTEIVRRGGANLITEKTYSDGRLILACIPRQTRGCHGATTTFSSILSSVLAQVPPLKPRSSQQQVTYLRNLTITSSREQLKF